MKSVLHHRQNAQGAAAPLRRCAAAPLRRCTVALQHAPRYVIAQQHTPEGQALLALNYLGPRHTTDEVLQRLRERVPSEAFRRLDKRKLPNWLRHRVTALETPPRD